MKIINDNIYHSRLGSKINSFTYRANYFEFDFFENKHINEFKILSINKFNLLSVDESDYCLVKDKSLFGWVSNLCKDKSNQKIDKIKLITMPKVLGYVFNPVSFIFCYQNNEICSLILKVNSNSSSTIKLITKFILYLICFQILIGEGLRFNMIHESFRLYHLWLSSAILGLIIISIQRVRLND